MTYEEFTRVARAAAADVCEVETFHPQPDIYTVNITDVGVAECKMFRAFRASEPPEVVAKSVLHMCRLLDGAAWH